MASYLFKICKKILISFSICFSIILCFVCFLETSFAGSLKEAMSISTSGMQVQSARMKIIAENLANISSTATYPGGKPYTRKQIFFKNIHDRKTSMDKVIVSKISRDKKEKYKARYEPTHPAADSKGYVLYPNISISIEMADMKEASRSYEANMSAVTVSKRMSLNTIDLLK